MAGIVSYVAFWSVLYALSFFAAILWHEFGHYVMMCYYGGAPPHVKIEKTPRAKVSNKDYRWWKHALPFPLLDFVMTPRNPCKIDKNQWIVIYSVGISAGYMWLFFWASLMNKVIMYPGELYFHVPANIFIFAMYCFGSLYDMQEIQRLQK